MYERLAPGKCLENAERGDFHHVSYFLTLTLQPPAKKCPLHGPLGQALAKEATGKPQTLYSHPVSLVPQPLPSLETEASFFGRANHTRQSAANSWHLHFSKPCGENGSCKGPLLSPVLDDTFFPNHNCYFSLSTKRKQFYGMK